MKSESLVSVIIPAYNASSTIISCINSVLQQTYPSIEIIIINDGSNDDTQQLVENYKKVEKISNLSIYEQINSGPSVARNNGINLAKGKYIAFLDSDDSWAHDKIEKQVRFLENNKDAVLIGTLIYEKKNKNYVEYISFKKLLLKNYFSTPTVMCCSFVFKYFQFNSRQKYSEDYRLWLQIAERFPCYLLNEHLTFLFPKRTFGAKGLSANLWEMQKGEQSNYYYFYQKKSYSLISYIFLFSYSFLKFIRRYVICKLF